MIDKSDYLRGIADIRWSWTLMCVPFHQRERAPPPPPPPQPPPLQRRLSRALPRWPPPRWWRPPPRTQRRPGPPAPAQERHRLHRRLIIIGCGGGNNAAGADADGASAVESESDLDGSGGGGNLPARAGASRGAALRRTNMSTLSRKTWTSGPLHRSLHRHCRAQPGAWQWRPPPHAEGRRKRRAPRIDIDNADSGGKVHQTIVKRPRMSRDGDWLWRRRRLEWGRRAPLVWCAHGAGQRPNLSPDAGPYRRPVRTCQRNSPSPTWRKSPSLHCRSLTVSVGHEHRQHLASGTWPHAQNIT